MKKILLVLAYLASTLGLWAGNNDGPGNGNKGHQWNCWPTYQDHHKGGCDNTDGVIASPAETNTFTYVGTFDWVAEGQLPPFLIPVNTALGTVTSVTIAGIHTVNENWKYENGKPNSYDGTIGYSETTSISIGNVPVLSLLAGTANVFHVSGYDGFSDAGGSSGGGFGFGGYVASGTGQLANPPVTGGNLSIGVLISTTTKPGAAALDANGGKGIYQATSSGSVVLTITVIQVKPAVTTGGGCDDDDDDHGSRNNGDHGHGGHH